MVENKFTLKGVLNEIVTRNVPNKKKPEEPDYVFNSIKLETITNINGREVRTIPELHLDRDANIEGFHEGDPIEVDIYLIGKKVSDNWYKTEARACFLKHSDGQRQESNIYTRPTVVDDFPAKGPIKEEEFDDDLPF